MTSPAFTDLDRLCADTLRLLAVDMVEAANSGHPGLPLGAAHVAHVLWTRHLRHSPQDPAWPNRDRFILSAGHGSALLYGLLHLTGYDLPMEELKAFRQWGSRTPGHPEVHHTPGVEVTTGPLGQGFANGVGMAMAQRVLAERYAPELFDHRIFAIVSDGDLMEGIASEAASLAGHQRLGRLVYVYDDNKISIDGSTDITFTEDVGARFEAYGWHVQRIDGHDLEAIDAAISAGVAEEGRPSIICARTHIGLDSPLQDSSKSHGAALGPDNVKALKDKLNWPGSEPFHVPEEAEAEYRKAIAAGRDAARDWASERESWSAANPELAAELDRVLSGDLPEGLEAGLPSWTAADGPMATRKSSGAVIQALAARMPELVGGSADLAGSNNTTMKETGFLGIDEGGRNVHFGIREHAMGAVGNAMALSGLRPFVATFLIFSDYLRPSIRLAALGQLPVVYVMTHDGIGVGEDGPTHQPIEQLSSLRAMPGLTVLRPADANETREAWLAALEGRGPALLALSRQNLPVLDRPDGADARKGAYVLRDPEGGAPELVLIGTGSEVSLALEAAALIEAGGGPRTRVVSMPSSELFSAQPASYREQVLPAALKARVAVEAGSSWGWERWVGDAGAVVGLDRFGASAPAKDVYRELGMTAEAVAGAAREVLDRL
jgi:transketolase